MICDGIEAFAAALPPNRGIAGLDLGDKTIGVALSDLRRQVATPIEVIRREKFTIDAGRLLALLEGEASEHSVQTVVEKLGTTLAQPFQVQTHQLQISASIGVARFPDDGQDVDTLLHRADTAMYEVKLRQRQQEAATLPPPPPPPAPCA